MQSPHIIRTNSAPVSAPPETGIHWINDADNTEFFSVGTSTVADWIPRVSSTISEAPIDSKTYGRKDASWTEIVTDLGYTAENVANKENTTVDTSTTKYPTVNLLNTYTNQQRKLLHCGPTSLAVVTNNTNGNITVSSITANFNSQVDFTGNINTYTVPSLVGYQLTANTYTYITADYNSGTPIYQAITNNNLVNHSTILNVVQVYWEKLGAIDELHIFHTGTYGLGLSNKIGHRLIHTDRFGYESGLMLSELGTRNFAITSGRIWYDGEEIDTLPVNTTTNNYHFYYHNATSWNVTALQQYNNTQYDNGTNLVTLNNNKYAVNWVYKCVNSSDTCSFVVLGNGDYTLNQAQSSQPPTLPDVIAKQGLLVGRIIILKGASVATQIDSAFSYTFTPSTVSDHANLINLDFASSGHTGFEPAKAVTDYYVTSAEKTLLSNTSGVNTGDQNLSGLLPTSHLTDFVHADIAHTNRTALNAVSGTNTGDQYIPSALSEFTEDATHRVVTDVEKSTWNGKQDALGFTAVPTTRTVNGHDLSTNVTVTKSDVGLSNVTNVDTTIASNITQDTTHRFVTDTQTGVWDAKQNALGFTAVPDTRTVNGHALTANVTVSKSDVGLGNVPNLDTSDPSNITQSATYRFVSDTEKSTWNGKQDSLGFTAENVSNKSDNDALGTSTTLYPTQRAVKAYVDAQTGSAVAMEDITNVVLTNPQDGEVLAKSGTNWVNVAPSATVASLDNIGDVVITTPTDQDRLIYDTATSTWINGKPLPSAAGNTHEIQVNDAGVISASADFRFDIDTKTLEIGQPTLSLPTNPINIAATLDSYLQVNMQNKSNGTSASSDFVMTADTGNDTVNYIDIGKNGSAYALAGYEAYEPLDGYVLNNGANLILNAADAGAEIKLVIGGTEIANIVGSVTESGINLVTGGNFSINNVNLPKASEVLPSTAFDGLDKITVSVTQPVNPTLGALWVDLS